MKRKEMVKILLDEVNKYFDNRLAISGASKILKRLEEAGMKPPHVSEEDTQAIMHVYYGGYSVYQWDEDLAKDEKVQEMKKRRAESLATRVARIQQRRNE